MKPWNLNLNSWVRPLKELKHNFFFPVSVNHFIRWILKACHLFVLLKGSRASYFKKQLPMLLADQSTIRSILRHISHGRRWPDIRRSGLFKHEVLLYLDPARVDFLYDSIFMRKATIPTFMTTHHGGYPASHSVNYP